MRADAARRRQAIITAALELFRAHGNNVSLEKIAAHAGVGIATLYRNFPDRQALIDEYVSTYAQRFIDTQNTLLERLDSAPESAGETVCEYARQLLSLGLGVLIPNFLPSNLDSLPPEQKALQNELMDNGARFIEKTRALGHVGPGVTHLEFIAGLLALQRPRDIDLGEAESDLDNAMVRIYLAGIRVGIRPD
ncbi:TetR/AcrR family transcriptional regulator [Corynebacterium sp. 32222D000AT]|uniref:TetR/AcrR family transcriptional regulator n=1 Tax=unclassified Corynebacterium TaxID=2624378 RepID=UPI002A92AEC7|nr:TetR/AcrR family transcriptional regulator [Mycobacteriaceae bacterium]MDY5828639.1 TetR/AcrR family transcriptional regulator [Corynebacterium sp.]